MKILVLGSTGLVGSSLMRLLETKEEYDVVGATRKDADLFSYKETYNLVSKTNPVPQILKLSSLFIFA